MRLRVPEVELRTHHLRMLRTGAVLLLGSVVVGIGAPMISTYLGLFSAAAVAGLVVALGLLRRAWRELNIAGALDVEVADGGKLTVRREGAAPHLVAQPALGGQAFADHLQVLVATPGGNPYPLELPLTGPARQLFLKALAVPLPERPQFARQLLLVFTLVPGAVMVLYVGWRVLVLGLAAGGVAALQQLPPSLGLTALLGVALLGLFVRALRSR
ncbi:MAG: hypothetical protein IPJ65_19385 [Archangiaceae bacterium]|nr:hypothetical protein [Archangiaceae bacterium]